MARIIAEYPVDLDPYALLQVSRDASLNEIRQAYRKQVFKAHPDKNPDRAEWSERRTRQLVQAFEILGDAEKRREYDRQSLLRSKRRGRRVPRESDLFFFRKNDPECLAMRALYFLVHMRGDEAADLIEETEDRLGEDFLRKQLDRTDYLDCLFLLGEHLIKRKRYTEALERLLVLYRCEKQARFRRHYFDMTLDHLKALYLRHLPRVLDPESLAAALRRGIAEVSWTRKEVARLHLALAKALNDQGHGAAARESVAHSLAADPCFVKAKRWEAEFASG